MGIASFFNVRQFTRPEIEALCADFAGRATEWDGRLTEIRNAVSAHSAHVASRRTDLINAESEHAPKGRLRTISEGFRVAFARHQVELEPHIRKRRNANDRINRIAMEAPPANRANMTGGQADRLDDALNALRKGDMSGALLAVRRDGFFALTPKARAGRKALIAMERYIRANEQDLKAAIREKKQAWRELEADLKPTAKTVAQFLKKPEVAAFLSDPANGLDDTNPTVKLLKDCIASGNKPNRYAIRNRLMQAIAADSGFRLDFSQIEAGVDAFVKPSEDKLRTARSEVSLAEDRLAACERYLETAGALKRYDLRDSRIETGQDTVEDALRASLARNGESSLWTRRHAMLAQNVKDRWTDLGTVDQDIALLKKDSFDPDDIALRDVRAGEGGLVNRSLYRLGDEFAGTAGAAAVLADEGLGKVNAALDRTRKSVAKIGQQTADFVRERVPSWMPFTPTFGA
ncbi:MAG: hypothetical protein EOM26_00800 [Alphaproteobacteria bacterium]|nr:hypothetical protein [Alphaproteobacteria bacterium]